MSNQESIEVNLDRSYQNVYVTLQNGTVGLFSGPFFVTDPTQVESVQFSLPTDLPDGETWSSICKDKSYDDNQTTSEATGSTEATNT